MMELYIWKSTAVWSQTCIVIQWVQCPSVGWVAGMHLRWAIHCSEWGESSVSYYSPLQPVPSKSCDRPGNSHPSNLWASIFMCFWCSICGLPILCLSNGCQSCVVWCRSSPCDERGWSMQLFIISWWVTYILSDRLDADTRGTLQYLSFVLPVCIYAVCYFDRCMSL